MPGVTGAGVEGAAIGASMAGVYGEFGVAGASGVVGADMKPCRASGRGRPGVVAPFWYAALPW
jgi:hypothetical protein